MTVSDAATLDRIKAALDVMSERREAYCPRCQRVTRWFNSCRDGRHKNFECLGCGIREGDRLTEAEWQRQLEASP